MALVRIPVPSLAGGVTEQPSSIARPDRLKSCINWLPWAEAGLVKRPGTEWRTRIFDDPVPKSTIKSIDLGGGEKYVLVFSQQNVTAFFADGSPVPVRGAGPASAKFDYLDFRSKSLIRSEEVPGLTSSEDFSGDTPAWTEGQLDEPDVRSGDITTSIDQTNRSPLGWQIPPGVSFDPLSHFTIVKVPATGLPFEWSLDKTIDGGVPNSRAKFSAYVFTTPAQLGDPTGAFAWMRIGFHYDNPIDNTLYAEFRWDAAQDPLTSLPSVSVNDSAGESIPGLTGHVEQVFPGGNVFRIMLDIDMAAAIADPKGPGAGNSASFHLWGKTLPSQQIDWRFWGAHVGTGGDEGVFLDYEDEPTAFETKTVVDTTFVLNKDIIPLQDDTNKSQTKADVFGTQLFEHSGGGGFENLNVDDLAIVFVKQGFVDTDYSVRIKLKDNTGTNPDVTIDVTHTTPGGGAGTDDDTTEIANKLASLLESDPSNDTSTGFSPNTEIIVATNATTSTVVIKVREDWEIKELTANDSVGSTAISAIHQEVTTLDDLPIEAWPDMRVRLIGPGDDGSSPFTRAVMKFSSEGTQTNLDAGFWEEAVDYNLVVGIDEDTMPHILVRKEDDAAGTVTGEAFGIFFEYGPFTWNDRLVGDDDTNAIPDFIQDFSAVNIPSTILDIGFHKGRLILTSDQDVWFSEANRFGNFFRTTTLDLPAADRIALKASSAAEAVMRHVRAVGGRLFLFSNRTVFILEEGQVLSPSTAAMSPILGVGVCPETEPRDNSDVIIFTTESETSHPQVYTIIPLEDGRARTAILNQGLPEFIPLGCQELAVENNLSAAFFLANDDRTRVVFARPLLIDENQLSAAWAEIETDDDDIVSLDVLRDELILAVKRDDELHLEAMPIVIRPKDEGESWAVRLDRRITENDLASDPTYDAGNDETTFTLPYDITIDVEARTEVVVRGGGAGVHGAALTINSIDTTPDGNDTIKVSGDHTSTSVFIGFRYESEAKMLDPVLQDSAPGGGSFPRAAARIRPRRLTVGFVDTNHLDIGVDRLGTIQFDTFDETDPRKGELRAMILQSVQDVDVTLVSISHKAANPVSAEWEAEIIARGTT